MSYLCLKTILVITVIICQNGQIVRMVRGPEWSPIKVPKKALQKSGQKKAGQCPVVTAAAQGEGGGRGYILNK